MGLRFGLLCLVLVAGAITTDLSRAQESAPTPQPVKVGLYVSPPFVMEGDGGFSGMAVELWETIATDLDLRSDYRVLPALRELVQATASGEIDIAVTNLTITRAGRSASTSPTPGMTPACGS